MDDLIDGFVHVFAAGLIEAVASEPQIVNSWLSTQLPTREYAKEYAPPTRLVLGPMLSIKNETADNNDDATNGNDAASTTSAEAPTKRVKFFDYQNHVATGETTTLKSTRADGTKTTQTTDVGADTSTQLLESCNRSFGIASELMHEHIFGSDVPRATLLGTLARLFVVLLFEPVRVCIDMEFTKPATSDVRTQLSSAINTLQTASQDELLESDRLLQTHLASFTVNWFSDVVELGVPYRSLSPAVIDACRIAAQRSDVLFDPARCDVSQLRTRLTGFRYNARIAARLDRGALLSAFCKTFIAMQGAGRGGFTRNVCTAAIDRAFATAWNIAATKAGARFATQAVVERVWKDARSTLVALEFRDERAIESQVTPLAQLHQIALAINSKY